MPRKNDQSGFFVYMPMILAAAFLIGCFTVALGNVRSGARRITDTRTLSQSDVSSVAPRDSAPAKVNGGLRYRFVSRTDSPEETSSELPSLPDVSSAPSVSSQEETVASVTSEDDPVAYTGGQPEPVSSEPETDPGEELAQSLFSQHYINFVPPKEGRIAYLTFDDGPSEYTNEILDILDYYNVKATFFVIYHKDMEERYKAIAERGHTIGLHTYTHDYARIYRSETAFFNDMQRIDSYVYSVTGVHSKIIRFPGGSSNTVSRHYSQGIMDRLKVSVPARGYVYHDWNVDSEDAAHNNLDPDIILENVKKNLTKYRKPDILMHDSGAGKHTTVEALPAMIEYIYSQGYRMERLELDSYAVHHNW